MHSLIWQPSRSSTEPGRCYHHKTAGRTPKKVPVVVRALWRNVTVPVMEIGFAVRDCCVRDDPAARVAWWDAVLDALPPLLADHPEIDANWLLGELARDVPWPSDEDAVVAHLLTSVNVPGKSTYQREAVFPKLVEAARIDARRLLTRAPNAERDPHRALVVAGADAYFRRTFGAKAQRTIGRWLEQ